MSDDSAVGTTVPLGGSTKSAVAERLGGQALYVLAGNVFTFLVGLPLQIYVSRTLGSSGLGTFSLLEGIAGTIAGLLSLGLAPTAVRFIPQYLEERNFESIRKLVLRGALALTLLGFVGYLVFLVFCFNVSSMGFLRSAPFAVIFMGAMIPLGMLTYFMQQSLRGLHEIRYLIAGSSFLQLSVKAAATIIAFLLGARLAGYTLASSVAAFVALIWMASGLLRKLRATGHPTRREVPDDRPLKRYAAISFATSLISLPSAYLDRFLLGVFAGTGAVGVLVVARQLQQLPAVLFQMLMSVAAPMFSSAHARNARDEQEHLYTLITDWAVKAALPVIMFLWLFARPVLSLFGPQFAEIGTAPVQVLMAAQLFSLASGPNGNMAIMCGLERQALRIDMVTLLATAVLLFILVPEYGLLGVALSVLANSVFHNAWTLLLVRNRLQIRWWDKRYLSWAAPTAAAATLGLLATRAFDTSSVPMLVLCLGAMYGTFGGVSLLQGLHGDDRELIALVRRQFAIK